MHRSLVVRPDSKQAVEFADTQLSIFWLPGEVEVEKDIQDVLVNMTESEKHGVITTLKLFSLYEDFAGEEYWGGRFKDMFKDDIAMTRMASAFSMFETCIHLPFYNKLNELLHLNTDEFYNSYVQSPVLAARMDFIDEVIGCSDPLVSLGGFSMVEGAILYSSFAFLKHFQSKGKNKLLNVVRGINFSVRDENLHSIASAWAYKKMKQDTPDDQVEACEEILIDMAQSLYEHECEIIEMIFEKGSIEGITKKQMMHFVESRIDECLRQLDIKPLYKPSYNPIADWFYDGINGFQFNDFFSGIGSSYSREWAETKFTWEVKNNE